MKNDPIIEEVRIVRERIAKEHDYNPKKIFDHLTAEGQKHSQDRLVYEPESKKQKQTA